MQALDHTREECSLDTEQPAPDCGHHWVIDSPAGQTSRGVCKRCGAERDFSNSLDDAVYVPFDRADLPAFQGATRLP